jgi:hypothetical protein
VYELEGVSDDALEYDHDDDGALSLGRSSDQMRAVTRLGGAVANGCVATNDASRAAAAHLPRSCARAVDRRLIP